MINSSSRHRYWSIEAPYHRADVVQRLEQGTEASEVSGGSHANISLHDSRNRRLSHLYRCRCLHEAIRLQTSTYSQHCTRVFLYSYTEGAESAIKPATC